MLLLPTNMHVFANFIMMPPSSILLHIFLFFTSRRALPNSQGPAKLKCKLEYFRKLYMSLALCYDLLRHRDPKIKNGYM